MSFPLMLSPPLYAYAPMHFSLYLSSLLLTQSFLSSSSTQLYMELSIGESVDISGPQR
jgi:hypothetical protein